MNVVAVLGSPHAGNTEELTRTFERELTSLGDVDFHYIRLRESDLRPCRGCFLCFVRGEDACPLDDDHDDILCRLDAADGVVFVSPVYSMHVSCLFKLFVDRFAYTFHRPRFMGKYAVTLAATGGIGLKETLTYMRGVAVSWGFHHIGGLEYIAPPPRNTSMKALMRKKDRTREVALAFHRAMKERPPRKLSLEYHIHFTVMQAVYSRIEEMSPADYRYWKDRGWLDRKRAHFSDNVRTNPLKRLVARSIAWFTGRSIDKAS